MQSCLKAAKARQHVAWLAVAAPELRDYCQGLQALVRAVRLTESCAAMEEPYLLQPNPTSNAICVGHCRPGDAFFQSDQTGQAQAVNKLAIVSLLQAQRAGVAAPCNQATQAVHGCN